MHIICTARLFKFITTPPVHFESFSFRLAPPTILNSTLMTLRACISCLVSSIERPHQYFFGLWRYMVVHGSTCRILSQSMAVHGGTWHYILLCITVYGCTWRYILCYCLWWYRKAVIFYAIVYWGIGSHFCCSHLNMPVCTEMLPDIFTWLYLSMLWGF